MFTAPKYINPQWNLLNIAQSKNLFFGISPLEIAYKSREGIHELFEMSICTQVRQSRNSDGSETVLKLFQNYWKKGPQRASGLKKLLQTWKRCGLCSWRLSLFFRRLGSNQTMVLFTDIGRILSMRRLIYIEWIVSWHVFIVFLNFDFYHKFSQFVFNGVKSLINN